MQDVIVDISHHNEKVDFKTLKSNGILGVIHKATEGKEYTDSKYASRKKTAIANGLLWGAYHFGVGGDGSAQADNFLNVVQPVDNILIALDFEPINYGPSMSLTEAESFVQTIFDSVGRWPVLYSGHYLKEFMQSGRSDILTKCPLWIAQYSNSPVLPRGWSQWALWQYTDGSIGPKAKNTPGVGKCDRNFYNDHSMQLTPFWTS